MNKEIKILSSRRLKNSKHGNPRYRGNILIKNSEIGHIYTYEDIYVFKTQSDSKCSYQIREKWIEEEGCWITVRCHWTKKGTLIIEEVRN